MAASKALSDAADAVSEDAESLKQASEEAEEAAKEAAWHTKHVDTDEALVVTIPVSIVIVSGDHPHKK